MSYDPPLKVTIPSPSPFRKRKGIHSTGHQGGNMRVRCTDAEYKLIRDEAAELGVTISTFGRWCAIRTAEALLEHRLQSRTTIEAEIDDDGEFK